MRIKFSETGLPNERVDGIAYSAYGENKSGKVWSYPTSRPSSWFTQTNEQVRMADSYFEAMDEYTQATWYDWFYDLTPMELCMLWDELSSGRDEFDQVKAAYVNNYVWASFFGASLDSAPPSDLIYPLEGEYVFVEGAGGLSFGWARDEGDPPVEPFYGVWGSVSMRQPVYVPPIRKQKFLGVFRGWWWTAIPIYSVVQSKLGIWSGCCLSLSVAMGYPGSAPLCASRTVTYL